MLTQNPDKGGKRNPAGRTVKKKPSSGRSNSGSATQTFLVERTPLQGGTETARWRIREDRVEQPTGQPARRKQPGPQRADEQTRKTLQGGIQTQPLLSLEHESMESSN